MRLLSASIVVSAFILAFSDRYETVILDADPGRPYTHVLLVNKTTGQMQVCMIPWHAYDRLCRRLSEVQQKALETSQGSQNKKLPLLSDLLAE